MEKNQTLKNLNDRLDPDQLDFYDHLFPAEKSIENIFNNSDTVVDDIDIVFGERIISACKFHYSVTAGKHWALFCKITRSSCNKDCNDYVSRIVE